jgi:hypothetical protein
MRALLFVLLLLVVGVIGLGFHQGWFSLSTSRDSAGGKAGVQLSIDQDKMKADTQKARNMVTGAAGQAKERSQGK